jgi:protein gp37
VGETTAISWCDATFNPVWGCQRVSEGCGSSTGGGCYAEAFAKRVGHGKRLPTIWGPAGTTERRTFGDDHWREPLRWDRHAARDGVRRRVFVGSMCDWAEDHPTVEAELPKLWQLVERCPSLDFLLLTKRPENIRDRLPPSWLRHPRPNVWLGTTCETQARLDARAPILLDVPAVVHFFSCEPLLESLDLRGFRPAWCLIGGESGPRARFFASTWARSLIEQCRHAGIRPFMKQMGSAWAQRDEFWRVAGVRRHPHGADPSEWPSDLQVQEFPSGAHA